MLQSILIGVVLAAVTVMIHGLGIVAWIEALRRRRVADGRVDARRGLVLLATTAAVLIVLHVVEVALWALTYRLLPGVSGLASIEDAVYFSFVTFTTVGYGDITIGGSWRLLAGIEALNGILLFGWSAAVFFALVQRVWLAGRDPSAE
jgi:voltage-gated potassium channel